MVNSWEYKKLHEVLKNGKDGIKIGPFGSQLKKEFLQTDGEYRVYGQENVYTDDFRIGTRYISAERFRDLSSCELVPNDIVISTMGTIGKCSIVPDYIVPGIMDSHLVRLRTNSSIDKHYFRYYIQSELVQRQIKDLSVGGIMDGLSTTIIRQLEVAVPPFPEQRAIAAVLSDADAYIAALEKLIAKKRAIKQGAMQELLTGKRRLPGFEGEWVEITLGDICEIKDGTHQTPKYEDYGVPFYSVENVTNDNFTNTKYISLSEHRRLTANYRIERGDILMTRIGSIGVCKYVDWDVDASFYVSLALLKCKAGVDARYLSLYSQSEQFQKEIELHSLQHAIPKKINLGNIALVRLPLPTFAEQTAIAAVLSDMDAEIDALTAKLNKAKYIKQGMMSELLTGRIRLVEQEAPAEPVAATKVVLLPKQEAKGHNQQFDDAVMIAGIVNALYSDKYPLGRKKVQKCLYLLRRHQDESTEVPLSPATPSGRKHRGVQKESGRSLRR